MLRDLVLTSCILFCLGLTFRYPFAGVLTWTWVALMQPHNEVYGVVSNVVRINLLVAVVTLLSWSASRDHKIPRFDSLIKATVIFLAWMTFTNLFAEFPAGSWDAWNRYWRIMALGFMVWATANSKTRIHALTWVIVASFMYYGVKAGLLTILAGGIKKTMGPGGGMYGDNNQFAVALLMILPLITYLRSQSANQFVRIGLAAGFVLTLFAIVGSYSRGAFIGLAALGLVWLLRSRNKITYVVACAVVSLPVFWFMPQSYYDRMSTLHDTDADSSFQGRVAGWKVAYYYARDHFPLGAGLDGPQQSWVFGRYFPGQLHAAHSIYFQVLGDLGFPGLVVYLLMLFLVFRYCSRIRRFARYRPELLWAHQLATAIQLSMVAFCVAGAGVSLAYSDLLFMWTGLLPPLWCLIKGDLPYLRGRAYSIFAPIGPSGIPVSGSPKIP